MQHIYIHVPFCLKKCGYCSFYSETDQSLTNGFIDSLIFEMNHFAEKYPDSIIETIYIGGGTPSLIEWPQIEKIAEHLRSTWKLADNVEFTIEMNPETVTKEKLRVYSETGINRISVGVQSFSDRDLKYLGRIHDSKKAKAVLEIAGKLFKNINIDLIFGLPGQTAADTEQNIRIALKYLPKHISNYELTFEEGTSIYNDREKTDHDDPALYLHAKSVLESCGYVQYEISNFSLPGYECAHNMAYWSDKSYLGLGPSAHSYDRDKKVRWHNAESLTDYILAPTEQITEKSQSIDNIITGLRKISGMPLSSVPSEYRKIITDLKNEGLLKTDNQTVAFTQTGILLSNQVLLKIMSANIMR